MSPAIFPRENNFDLLRLVFALQVVFTHAASDMAAPAIPMIEHFPGVPAFFFVSGFLIYPAYLLTGPKAYAENRFLRIFPGLLFVTLGGVGIALLALGTGDIIAHPGIYATWAAAQLTIGQAYNPEHFRSVGTGVINGSLWTIAIEIGFYVAVPIIVRLEKRWKHAVGILAALSFLLYVLGPSLPFEVGGKTVYEILAITPLPWAWMFLLGVLAVKHFDRLPLGWLAAGLPILALLIFLGAEGPLFDASGSRMGLVYFVAYAAAILWVAFRLPTIRLSGDLSYGIYVWHMPVIQLLLIVGIPGRPQLIGLTFLMALFSWIVIEQPALRLKRRSVKVETKQVCEPVGVGIIEPNGQADGAEGKDSVDPISPGLSLI